MKQNIALLIQAGSKIVGGTGIQTTPRFTRNQEFCKSFIANLAECLENDNVLPIAKTQTVSIDSTVNGLITEGVGRNYTKDGVKGTIATNDLAVKAVINVKLLDGQTCQGTVFVSTAATLKGTDEVYVKLGRVPNNPKLYWVTFEALKPELDRNVLAAFAETFEPKEVEEAVTVATT